jgi:hypothetical protein
VEGSQPIIQGFPGPDLPLHPHPSVLLVPHLLVYVPLESLLYTVTNPGLSFFFFFYISEVLGIKTQAL